MHVKAAELQEQISRIPGLSLKECSDTHYQVTYDRMPIVNYWPTTGKYAPLGKGPQRAIPGPVEEIARVAIAIAAGKRTVEGPTAYRFTFSANLAKVIPAVNSVLNEVNGHMRDFGFSEKLTLRGPTTTAVLSGVRRLSIEEQNNTGALLLSKLQEAKPDYEWQLDSCVEVGD